MEVKEWLGEENKLGIDIWEKKYRHNGETFDAWVDRVSGGVPEVRELILSKRFLFGGRILANRGIKGSKVTYSNCYVVSPPEDNIESIFESLSKLARTFSYGGGCGVDIGKLRPKDATVNNAAKKSSGAVSFMDLYSMTTSTISQQGRRGALMISIPISHPDVEEFIGVKNDVSRVTSANISVRVDNKFMVSVVNDSDYTLHFELETGEKIEKIVKARELFNKLCKNNWDSAEPGILFWDEIKNRNLLVHDKNFEYAGTNPCAEEPLPAGGSCLLGAINLSEFVKNSFQSDAYFDAEGFQETVHIAVNALNDVLDEGLSLHPLAEQRESVANWRQIGLGIMGLADCLIRLGYVYGSAEANQFCDTIAHVMFGSAVLESDKRGGIYGPYPMFDAGAVNASPMLADAKIQVEHLNNSQLLTIAPTGTISTMLGVSGGIEPIFANSYTRKTQSLHGKKEDVFYKVYTPIVKEFMEAHGITDEKNLPTQFVTSADIRPKDRINCQASWQKWIDASISSTINLPHEATVEDVVEIYTYAWKKGLKGVTVYRAGCSREGVLVSDEEKQRQGDEKNEIACDCNNSADVEFDSITPVSRKTLGTTSGQTFCKKSSCGTLYITINRDADGNVVESFVNASKGGICQSNVNAVNRLLSLCLRSGTKVEEVIDQLKGITCPACVKTLGKGKNLDGVSCPDIIAKTLQSFYKEGLIERERAGNLAENHAANKAEKNVATITMPAQNDNVELKEALHEELAVDKCPDCGEPLHHDGGCIICGNCGWSKCS